MRILAALRSTGGCEVFLGQQECLPDKQQPHITGNMKTAIVVILSLVTAAAIAAEDNDGDEMAAVFELLHSFNEGKTFTKR